VWTDDERLAADGGAFPPHPESANRAIGAVRCEPPTHVEQSTGPAGGWATEAGDRVPSGDGTTRWAAACRRGRGALGGRGLYFTSAAGDPEGSEPGREPGLHDLGQAGRDDLVLEGEATRVTDGPTLDRERVRRCYETSEGQPLR
jgi:hypothetical protein